MMMPRDATLNPPETRPAASPAELITAATALAQRIAGDLVVDERGHVGWISDEIDIAASTTEPVLHTGPVDEGLLTGRAGIALALAVAAWASADEDLAAIARLTIGQVLDGRAALGTDARVRPTAGLGWQSGDLGIASTADQIARLLEDRVLGRRAALLAASAVTSLAEGGAQVLPGYADLLDGDSGHLMAVLAARVPPHSDGARRAAATRLVDDLRHRAIMDGLGARWPMAGDQRTVTGMAHGSSGIALALTAGHAVGVEGADRDLIDAALEWDDAWHSETDGGWYDLRLDEPYIGQAWCHGAPGIGIAAATRARLGGAPGSTYVRALRSVRAALDASPLEADADGTLCHGWAGIVELHLAGAEAWPGDGEHLRAARRAASWIADGVGLDGTHLWAHGVRGGRTHALLDGTAGVILTLVRCVDPSAVTGATHPGIPAGA